GKARVSGVLKRLERELHEAMRLAGRVDVTLSEGFPYEARILSKHVDENRRGSIGRWIGALRRTGSRGRCVGPPNAFDDLQSGNPESRTHSAGLRNDPGSRSGGGRQSIARSNRGGF